MSMIVKNKNDRELLGSLGSTVLFLIIVFIAAGIFVGFLFFYEKKNQEIVPLATNNESYMIVMDEIRDKSNRLQSRTVYNKQTGDTYIYTYDYNDYFHTVKSKVVIIDSEGNEVVSNDS